MATSPLPAPDETPGGGGMSDEELAQLLEGHEQRAIGYFDSEIAKEQAKAIEYYYGNVSDVPVLDGCSSAVDHTVAITVDNGLASVLKPFVSAEEVVAFDPVGEEDVEMAEQATEYVNHVIHKDNPGFLILHNWFKDALLTKIGIVKVWWEDKTRREARQVVVDALQLEEARQAPGYLDEQDNGDGTFTVSIEEEIADGREKICGVPPEEFLISPHARSIEFGECPYAAHKPTNFTRSDLVALGFDRDIVDALPSMASDEMGEARRRARYADQEWYNSTREAIGSDKSAETIALLDEFVLCDFNGDGIAEMRRVLRVGSTILFNEEVDDNAFAILCPVPMPHKVIGRSLADQSMEEQKIGTAITRQTLDNLYKTNNPRPIVPDTARTDGTEDSLFDSSPGAEIRVKAPGQLEWSVVPFAADKSYPMLEYIHQRAEEKTGIQRKGNGLNADALKKNSPDTATQAAIDENSRNERAELIARIFAETGVKRLFKLILKDLVKYQPKARLIRLRNKFVEMNPQGWNPDMDLTISVGLGVGNKAEQIMQADAVLQTMAELQQTPYAYLIDAEKVHNALKRKFTAAGIKNVDDFLNDPKEKEAPPPQPNPEMAKVQADVEAKQAELGMKQEMQAAEMLFKEQEGQLKLELARQEAEARLQLERERAQMEADLAREKAQAEIALAQEKFRAELAMNERRMQMEERIAERNAQRAERETEAKISKNRPGGDLDK